MINQILTGDAKELSKLIPDESVDLVFTDPPYLGEYVQSGIYEWLGQESARILKPGGFLLAYTGTYWKARVMCELERHIAWVLWNGETTERQELPECIEPIHIATPATVPVGRDLWGESTQELAARRARR